MAKMNLATPDNTLKLRLADFAGKYWFRRLKKAQLEDKLQALTDSRKGMDKVDGTAVSFSDEDKEKVDTAIAETEKALAEVNDLEEGKFSFTHDADKALRSAWKKNTAMSSRCYAIQAWLEAFGLTCELGQAMTIAQKMGGYDIKAVKDEKVALDGANYTEDKTSINLTLLYKYMIDLHLEAGCFSPSLIPEDLKDIWQARRDLAKARKEAQKQAKKENK